LVDHKDLFNVAAEKAQMALDHLSVRGLGNLRLVDADGLRLLWWQGSHGAVIRLVACESMLTPRIQATGRVIRPDGHEDPAPPPSPIQWHESFRYFRMAQVTEDLLDAYRNMFLALEAILSDLVPMARDKERAWLKRALDQMAATATLQSLAPVGQNTSDYLVRVLWDDTRNLVFHAKTGLPTVLPGSLQELHKVRDALRIAGRLYLMLVQQRMGLKRSGGSFARSVLQSMTRAVFDGTVGFASDDPAPFDPAEVSPNPTRGVVATLPAVRDWFDELTETTGNEFAIDRPDSRFPSIRRIGTLNKAGKVGVCVQLPTVLNVANAERFELQLGIRWHQRSSPKADFAAF
jgi:hypothetical protein